jgi:UPF0271 protein
METIRVAFACRTAGVAVGAHPGYDDRERFGREETGQPADEIESLLLMQVAALSAVTPVAFLKPHGALYHRCQSDPAAADAAARVAARFGLALVGQPGMGLLAAAARHGLDAYAEGYADRAYGPDGRLRPRSEAGAVLDGQAAAEQAVRLSGSGRFQVLSLHGDSPSAAATVRLVRAALAASGIGTGPLQA